MDAAEEFLLRCDPRVLDPAPVLALFDGNIADYLEILEAALQDLPRLRARWLEDVGRLDKARLEVSLHELAGTLGAASSVAAQVAARGLEDELRALDALPADLDVRVARVDEQITLFEAAARRLLLGQPC